MFRQTKEPVRCPVCDDWIGDRWIQQPTAAYCNECKFTFYFKADMNVPHKCMKGQASDKKGECGCGRCGR